MRIAEVLTASTGGIGRHVASLAPRLAAAGHEVTIYCPAVTAAAHDFGAVPVRPLSRLQRAASAEVLHAHGYKAGGLALLPARLARTPLVVTWHNALLGDGALLGGGPRAGLLLRHLVARGADLTLGASTDLVQQARACGARRAELGPVAAPALAPPAVSRAQCRAALGVGPDDSLVVTVGRLAPQKNLGLLLDIAAQLRERPSVRFVVAGDGPLHEEVAARVRREGLAVRLLGRCNDVASLLGAADAVLLTSRWEARALVAQEALLAGVPLFGTRVGGLPELVGDAAVLFDPDDAVGAAGLLADALADPGRLTRMSVAGLQQAAGWPDEDQVAAVLAATYAALVAGRSAGSWTRQRRRT